MKFISLIACTGLMLLMAASCRSTKNIQKAIEKKDTVAIVTPVDVPTHDDTLNLVAGVFNRYQPVTYKTFAAKIKVDYFNSKGKQPDFVANVRMHKDSIIWISISNDLGIEGFRVMIDKDSIQVMDKLANTYQIKPLASMQEIVEIPFSFNDIQEIIVGNPVFFNRDSILKYSKTEKGYTLLSTGTIFKNLLSFNNEYLLEKSKLDDNNIMRNRTADLSYFEYENKFGFSFSTYRELFLSHNNKLDIQLKIKDYKVNEELTYPFNIPKKFKRIQ